MKASRWALRQLADALCDVKDCFVPLVINFDAEGPTSILVMPDVFDETRGDIQIFVEKRDDSIYPYEWSFVMEDIKIYTLMKNPPKAQKESEA